MMKQATILNYRVFPLGNFAFQFLHNRFKISSELTKKLDNSLDLSSGQSFTFFPRNIDENKLDYPENGGVLSIEEKNVVSINEIKIEKILNTLDGLASYISLYLKQNDKNIIVIENYFEDADDDIADTLHKILEGNNVYYYLTSRSQMNEIIETIKTCSSKPEAIGIFSRVKSDENFDLNEIVNNLEKIYIEAYDHEGYIIWEKNK